jgi:hypothetical protein
MELGEPNRLRMERTMSPTFICKAQLAHMKTSVHILELVQCKVSCIFQLLHI